MKTTTSFGLSTRTLAVASILTSTMLAGLAMADPTGTPSPQTQDRKVVVVTSGSESDDAAPLPGGKAPVRKVIRIESIGASPAKEPGQMVTWLGVSTEEVSDALTAQLGLKPGQGLVVVYVAPDSPAAKAGIQKYDVFEELGDQMLMGPDQLRKLVQMQKDGDTVKLTLHRAGKRQTVSVTLGKRAEIFSMGSGGASSGWPQGFNFSGDKNINWVQAGQDSPMAIVHVDKKMINAEVQRNMEQARQEIQEALRQSAQAGRPAPPFAPNAPGAPPLPPLPPSVAIGDGATITVTKDGPSVKTVVKSDDSGILVIVASPKKYLTAHDPNGKLLFDGPIETPEEQQKVPPPMWKKVKPLLEQIKPEEEETPEPPAQSDGGKESETKMAAGVLVLL